MPEKPQITLEAQQELIADVAAKVAAEVVKQQSTDNILLWLCFIIIAVLWAIVVFFTKRHLDKTDQKFKDHEDNHKSLEQKVSNVATRQWTENQIKNLKEQDINPMRTEFITALRDLRKDFNDRLDTIVHLLSTNKNNNDS